MSLSIDISTEDLVRAEKLIKSALSVYVPSGNFKDGTFLNDIVVRAMAVIPAMIEKEAVAVRARQSLSTISSLPPEEVDAALDDLVSNWFVTRKVGTRATGVATIHFSPAVDEVVEVPPGTWFQYSAGVSFVLDSEQGIVVNRDDQMTAVLDSDGSVKEYVLYVPIVCLEIGASGNVDAGLFQEYATFSPHVSYVELESAITTATLNETNSELIDRAKSSLTERGLITQRSLSAVLREEVADVQDVYVVGAGYEEMQRDLIKDVAYNLDIHVLGHVNVYCLLPVVRNALYPYDGTYINLAEGEDSSDLTTTAVTNLPFLRVKEANLSSGAAFSALVRVSIHSYVEDGVVKYKAYRSDTGLYADRASANLLPDEYKLECSSTSLFSSMEQPLTITVGNSSGGRSLFLKYDGTRSLASVDLILKDRDRRVAAANVLAYSFIPVVVTISISYYKKPTAPSGLPLNDAKAALSSYLNNNLFPNGLKVSDIVVFLMGTFPLYIQGVLMPITVNYVLQSPSGREIKFSTSNKITVEDMSLLTEITAYSNELRLLEQVSDNTVRYLCFDDTVTLTEVT